MNAATPNWIVSNARESAVWHAAVERESRGAKGTLFGTYYVAACSGRQLGGAYGQSMRHAMPSGPGVVICRRCLRKVRP